MNKKELRNLYKQKRLALTHQEKLKLDDLLLIQFQELSFDAIHSLMSYWPMVDMNEPNTNIFTRYLKHMIPGLQVAYPVTDFESHSMQAYITTDDTVFIANQYGLTEPKSGHLIQPFDLDLIFVPLIAFDERGNRVGYGKGFYDRFLINCHQETISIGFSYFNAVDKIEDANQFDVPLDYCITPDNIYEF